MAVAPDFLWPIVSITGLLAPLFLFAYYGFRVYCVANAEMNTNYQLGLAWFFLIIEFFQYLPGAMLYFNRVFVIRRPRRPKLNLEGDDVPVVSVLITACGEDHDTILNVVRAACETDWPKDRLSVILCDDGRSIDLEDKMLQVKRKYPHAHYTSRKQPEIPDYKAGNLNNGLAFSATLNDTPSPFVAGLDVDMIVQPNWLRAMMPHLLNDPKLAMTCPPQYFWNIPRNDRVRQDLDYFYAVTELVHDGLGSGDCVGSGYLARREAIDDIGGFPTYSISEDTACSSMLLGKGWSVAYIEEYLQCGEMPDSLSGHIKQRTRWTIGNVQTAIKLRFRLWGPAVPYCNARQRFAGLVFGLGSFVNSGLTWIGYIGNPLALLSGYPFVVWYQPWQLAWLLRLVCLWVFTDTAHKASMALFIGYRDGMRWEQADIWLVPYYTLSLVRGFMLPDRFGGTKPGFTPSGSLSSEIRERGPKPSGLYGRFRAIFVQQLVWIHACYILACLLGVALNLVRCFDSSARISTAYTAAVPTLSGHDRWVFLLTRIGWPPVWWLGQLISCWIPLCYCFWPPKEVTADEALQTDEKTLVRYPKEEYSRPIRARLGRLSDHWTLIVFLYTVVCFAASFYV
ncbi:Cellulose synthase catalytic subunit [Pyrenophora tritici-repentis]|uniref:Glycosyltransferase protein n=2 Tax=Pyrenophora tritici-repentis TaxID=45151 RepID=A0A5M9LDU8_9PLEO|nr:cellulose synthase catalytic subunit [Pyrenophora tritici-repentis Pt-1C-BFP]KAA8621466.1 Cellulose synthase catalytic subunit [Pyrenophora tritici-repentis]EDU43163.1 cellulose synthase catalytic subunit [Pyrenophora tritici-repentis Pt-1C-BFP]KAF7450707.1 Cellulose synthase catalytic protein [Pyrenophora tritici-repentis]KAF7573347.1 glycosyltransferase protein [Pyrenophora tritici-repentis]KAI0580418.1 Cellulose synthase catalytic subunit [Pyrenophora tritici-repentis]